MREFELDNCDVMSLPPLPEGLESLSAESNFLSNLPKLPSSLQYLNVRSNDLRRIPTWPRDAEVDFHDNPLVEFPPGLAYIDDEYFGEYGHLLFRGIDGEPAEEEEEEDCVY